MLCYAASSSSVKRARNCARRFDGQVNKHRRVYRMYRRTGLILVMPLLCRLVPTTTGTNFIKTRELVHVMLIHEQAGRQAGKQAALNNKAARKTAASTQPQLQSIHPVFCMEKPTRIIHPLSLHNTTLSYAILPLRFTFAMQPSKRPV